MMRARGSHAARGAVAEVTVEVGLIVFSIDLLWWIRR
jgi:hypothetical protein